MSKQHKIRWSEQDIKSLNKAVKNFNAKLKRLSKNNPEITGHLPETIKVKELKELINTRRDLNREINSLKRFSKRGAEDIVIIPDTEYELKITHWQRTEMNRRVGIINRKRKARLEQIESTEMTSRGQELGYTRGQLGMGKAEEVALSPMKAFFRTMNNTELKKRWKSILVQSQSDYFDKRDYQVRDNYIKGLLQNYNENEIKDIIEHIQSMDIKEFLQIFQQEGGTFEWAYPDPEQMKAYETGLRAIWLPNK